MSQDSASLLRDLRVAVVLGAYLHSWGLPESRVRSRRGEEDVDVYVFPPFRDAFYRFATVGLSAALREGSTEAMAMELLMVLPSALAGATCQEVCCFMLDVMSYSLRPDVAFGVGATIPETPLAPPSWKARALLLDEPTGEPEELSLLPFGDGAIRLIWLVPLHDAEQKLIEHRGLAAFDRIEQEAAASLVDPLRQSLLEDDET